MATLNIVIPVYNEGKNFFCLWDQICSQISSDFTALVIYDFNEDDTIPEVGKIVARGETRLHLLKNTFGRGVVGALRAGFDAVESGPIVVVMADLSDDLRQVDKMLELYRRGYHVVVGSRYMRGGRIIGGPFLKQSLSRLAGLTLHWFRGIPTHDATNAFKIYDTTMLKTFQIQSRSGFEINLELTVKAFLGGYKIAEIPATWRDRSEGTSKFRLWSWMPEYLRWYFYAFQPRQRHTIPKVMGQGREAD